MFRILFPCKLSMFCPKKNYFGNFLIFIEKQIFLSLHSFLLSSKFCWLSKIIYGFIMKFVNIYLIQSCAWNEFLLLNKFSGLHFGAERKWCFCFLLRSVTIVLPLPDPDDPKQHEACCPFCKINSISDVVVVVYKSTTICWLCRFVVWMIETFRSHAVQQQKFLHEQWTTSIQIQDSIFCHRVFWTYTKQTLNWIVRILSFTIFLLLNS